MHKKSEHSNKVTREYNQHLVKYYTFSLEPSGKSASCGVRSKATPAQNAVFCISTMSTVSELHILHVGMLIQ